MPRDLDLFERQLFDLGWDCKEERPRDDFVSFLGSIVTEMKSQPAKTFTKRIAVDGLNVVFVSLRADKYNANLKMTISFATNTLLSYAFGDVDCSLSAFSDADRIEEFARDIVAACAKAIRPNDKEPTP